MTTALGKVMRDSMTTGDSEQVISRKHLLVGKKLMGIVSFKNKNRVELQFEDGLSLVVDDVEIDEPKRLAK